jgi:hypothetical protein
MTARIRRILSGTLTAPRADCSGRRLPVQAGPLPSARAGRSSAVLLRCVVGDQFDPLSRGRTVDARVFQSRTQAVGPELLLFRPRGPYLHDAPASAARTCRMAQQTVGPVPVAACEVNAEMLPNGLVLLPRLALELHGQRNSHQLPL